ncbi:MAG: hypothetical protein ACJ788_01775 [Ktedonobacteraceae bacterium]
MTAIWQNDGSRWQLLSPTGFPNEATLHTLVEEALHLLPLASTPRLIVVGREVQLGNGRADLMAIEPSGRIAIIEIKLARNAEARRAVIARVLAYAAYLWGMEQSTLEQDVLSQHLQARGYESLAGAVESNDQEGSFDADTFSAGIAESLKHGHFRLVFVLDEAPEELVRLSSYLETISDQLIIDLISLSAYTVNSSQILVPQRVEAEPRKLETSQMITAQGKGEGRLVDGAGDFIASIETAHETSKPLLQRLSNWAIDLERDRLVKLKTYHGKSGILTLLSRLVADDVGLVSIYNNNGVGYLQFWRTVFERRAPKSLAQIESITQVKQGNSIREVSEELLNALTMAYREAVSRVIDA